MDNYASDHPHSSSVSFAVVSAIAKTSSPSSIALRSTLRRPRPPHFRTPRTLCPAAVFLPPGGAPRIPNDVPEDDADQKTKDPPKPPRNPRRSATNQRFDNIDRLLEETSPDYETWVDRNAKRSLSTFRGGSEWTLGADELNESLRPSYLDRHRHVLAPDEAFGAIFNWDVVVANSRELERLSWAAVAQEEKLPPPDFEDIVRAEDMAPEAAVSRVFYWTDDWGEIKRHVFRKHELFAQLQTEYQYEKTPGIENWLTMLARYGVKCILCAARPRQTVEAIISSLGLSKYFTKNDIVSSEDEYDSMEQMFLVAALKCERPPGKCVVFTDRPAGITAGHEVSSKVVAILGAHPAYEMKTADQIVTDYEGLVLYNIRRLFSESGMELMDPMTELEHERK